ncbi:MAG: VWA domain-containing protein [Candidatus Obscuribacterales bacterium]|nr:VWA domain-containing protein [Candidatus Obscuribacterales bacterium]
MKQNKTAMKKKARKNIKSLTHSLLLLSLFFSAPASFGADPCPTCGKKALQGGTESTMLQTGTESTTLQTGAENTLIQAAVKREGGPTNILFLIDCSQSMKEKISVGDSLDKEQKMEAAKRVLQNSVAQLPADVNIGIRVFGQSFRGDLSDCQQSALLVPIGNHNRRLLMEQVRQLRPYGLTPLTYGLQQAEQDLRYIVGSKTIILISDGAETCGGEPCQFIERLNRIGVRLKIDIVGLGLRRDRLAKDQLDCIAQKSGGKFYDANTSGELVNSINTSVREAISGKVLTKMKEPMLKEIIPPELRLEPAKP